MKTHTVIDGNAFYEIDEECYEELMRKKEKSENEKKHRGKILAAEQAEELKKPENKTYI